MSAFRDQFEQCPRCGIDLVDAGSVRGCQQCGGMWLREDVLTEMVLRMLPLGRFGRLAFVGADDRGHTVACPSCHAGMAVVGMHGVVVDRCAEHGIWFDADELQQVLQRTADPDRPSIIARATPLEPTPSPPGPPVLRFRVWRAGSEVVTELSQSVIKVGRLESAHLRLPDESGASRMHAVIEAGNDARVTLIDLGSTSGTTVNGERVHKARLETGDVIGIGDSTIEVEIVGSGTYPREHPGG